MKKQLIVILAIMLTLPEIAYAHTIAGDNGFLSGLNHPVFGLDHLLAMLSVGILSARIGGKSIWKIPAIFVAIMLLGGILSMNGIHIISVELGITLSIIVLGIAIASAKKLPNFIAMYLVGIFAIFHGHAHGTEMPHLAQPILYALGFIAGTAIIHIAGIIIALALQKLKSGQQTLKLVGAGIAGVGFYLLLI